MVHRKIGWHAELIGFIVVHRYIDHRGRMPKRKLDPLPAAAFQIMLALSAGELHGYAIMREVEEQTGGRLRLGPGTLYGSIQALLEGKLIEEVDRPSDAEERQERRRYYRLTIAGRKLARSEAERMADLLRVARARKILRGDYVWEDLHPPVSPIPFAVS
jgi:DNA-binding PadR family transcriptional regulator